MINEDKVKEIFQVARYESTDEKLHTQVGSFYSWDYIWKELLKSFFAGTIAFIGILILWVVCRADSILADINDINITTTAISTVLIYVAFLVIYMFITVLVYTVRYKLGRRQLRKYGEHLKKVQQMYEREQ